MAFMDTVTKLVSTVATALEGPVIPAVVSIAHDVVDLLQEAQDVVKSDDDAVELQSMLEELEPKVMAHADRTTAALRGEK
jgi:hypothetical protein